MAYFFILNTPPGLLLIILFYYLAAHRDTLRERWKSSPAKLAFLYAGIVGYVLLTAFLTIPPLYYALMMNRYFMTPILLIAVAAYYINAYKTNRWFPIPLPFLAIAVMPAAVLIMFWGLPTRASMDRILAQSFVRPIIIEETYCRKANVPPRYVLPNNLRRMAADPDGRYIYITVNKFVKKFSGLIRVDLRDTRRVHMMKLPGLHNLTIDKSGHTIYAAGYQSGDIYVVRVPEMKLLKTIHIADDRLQEVVLNEERGYFMTSGEKTSSVYVVDLKTSKITKTVRPPFIHMISVMHRNPDTGKTYTYGDLIMSSFSELDEPHGRYARRRIFPWGMGFIIAPGGKTAFINNSWSGYVHEIRLSDLKDIGAFRVRPGLRGLTFDEYRNYLYAGNYPDGYVDVVDMRTRRPVASAYFGKRVRCVLVTPKSHRVFVVSSYGLYEFNVDRRVHRTQTE